ncbi:MAG TPA: protein kinase [Gemmatimonadales bacterium]|jgi:serine/threonine protein kinase/tetratricopeptide (TPR) repeat protein
MTSVQGRLQSSLAERYAIEHEVGRGGMATVYLAQDLRHGRPVALKVLHPELAMSLGSERFLREIQIAARLQHPHIVPLYDSGQAGELLYYVMPFIEGESLRQLLERTPRLALEDAVRIARAVASALDYAHRQKIVHRDIKPENVMLSEGEPMVTDFGIAKAVSAAVAGSLTQTGTAVGTPTYMSPEQASGEPELDARSDIYSLGAMLYEMIGGTAPFVGPTIQAIIAKLFTEPAVPLREQRAEVPEWLDSAVIKALAKAPAGRYATAAQFAQALTWPSGTTTPPELKTSAASPKSIAVLPFVNMSNDPENEYFSDGVAEDIINALTKIQALRVASRTSTFAFKGKNEDIGEIGRKLKVATVLEGSVRKAGSRLRVTAQLVSVADGNNLWSERYDRQLEDVFEIQDEIAGNIVKALRVVLSEGEKRAIEKAATENIEAYEYYLRGRQFFHQWSRTGIQYARRMFERAIDIDPNYAIAYAGIADCCAFLYMYWDGSRANLEGAETASRKALDLAPELAETHASRGFALTLSGDYPGAVREFETAIRLNPNLYEAHYLYARAHMQEGKLEEAVRQFMEAARLRPEDYQALLLVQGPLRGLGRHEEVQSVLRGGLQLAEKHLELNPDDARALYLGATALIQLGERERALEWAGRARAANESDSLVLYNVACVYSLGGLKEEALECLEKAVQNGFGHGGWIDHDSDLDSLRGDPRFEALKKRL